jgi:hypothetical protein
MGLILKDIPAYSKVRRHPKEVGIFTKFDARKTRKDVGIVKGLPLLQDQRK